MVERLALEVSLVGEEEGMLCVCVRVCMPLEGLMVWEWGRRCHGRLANERSSCKSGSVYDLIEVKIDKTVEYHRQSR